MYVPYSLNIMPPFNYKPPLTICINSQRRYIYLQCTPPSAIHGKFNKNRRILRLQQTREGLELTVPPCIESSYLLARPRDWLRNGRLVASWWWCENYIAFSDHTHSAPFIIHCPAELNQCRLHHKQHETVTDNSAIAVSLAHSTARKGSV